MCDFVGLPLFKLCDKLLLLKCITICLNIHYKGPIRRAGLPAWLIKFCLIEISVLYVKILSVLMYLLLSGLVVSKFGI